MKMRVDFVSNSSSCSFIVDKPVAVVDSLKTAFGETIELPWQANNEMSVTLLGNKESLESIATALEVDKKCVYDSYSEDSSMFELTLPSFMSLLETSRLLLEKTTKLSISCEDTCEDGVLIVKLLNRFLSRQGFTTESIGDEFCSIDLDNSFIAKLAVEAFKNYDNAT